MKFKMELVTALFLLLVSMVVTVTDGFSFRINKKYEFFSNQLRMKLSDDEVKRFTLDVNQLTRSRKEVIFIGDSHARHMMALTRSAYGRGYYFKTLLPDVKNTLAKIDKSNSIIIAFRWQGEDHKEVTAFSKKILDEEKFLVILRDIPSFTIDPPKCLISSNSKLLTPGCNVQIMPAISTKYLNVEGNSNWEFLSGVLSVRTIRLLDIRPNLCDNRSCLTTLNGFLLYRDKNHLNEKLPPDIARKFMNFFDKNFIMHSILKTS